jgi:hypothetical protein
MIIAASGGANLFARVGNVGVGPMLRLAYNHSADYRSSDSTQYDESGGPVVFSVAVGARFGLGASN